MLLSNRVSRVFSALLVALSVAGARLDADPTRIDPPAPSSCDELTLVIERKFPTDCERRIDVDIDPLDGLFLPVRLTPVETQFPCNDVTVVEEFQLPLGTLTTGRYLVQITWVDIGTVEETLPLEVLAGGCARDHGFVRGDANSDSRVDIGDTIFTLNYLFLGARAPECLEAADSDGSEDLEVTDPVYLLNFLFLAGPAPPPPHAECGRPDGSELVLGCEAPHCFVDLGPPPVWMTRPDFCVQCEPCDAPSLEDVVAELESLGVEVHLSTRFSTPTCLACSVCPSGRMYAVLVDPEHVPLLESLVWTLSLEPPPSPEF